MITGILSTLGGKWANQRRLEIVSNNVANALTPGFKASRPVFQVTSTGSTGETEEVGQSYVNTVDSYVHFSDAPLVETGNPLDLAIEGNGFFAITTPTGTMYTRNGQFTLDKDKRLVTMSGQAVLGESGGEIILDGKEISVETDGSIFVEGASVDRIKVVGFADLKDLRNAGGSLFVNTNDMNVETAQEGFSVRQGFYEASNVDAMKEMVEIVTALRAYEAFSKVDELFSDSLRRLIDEGRI
jgi:flagellar basal-body rod protein FlgF